MEWKSMDDDDQVDDIFGGWDAEEEVSTQTTKEQQRDAILFMVDCQESMFEPNTEGEIPFEISIQSCIKFYKDKILSSATDFVGLQLYGTKHMLNAYSFNGIYIFHTLARPSAQRIKELESLISDRDAFMTHVGCWNQFPLHDAFWTSQHLFHGLPKTVAFKRIMVFTDDDNPIKGDAASRQKCLSRCKDLLEADITLQLFALRKGLPHQQASASPTPHLSSSGGNTQSSSDFLMSSPLKVMQNQLTVSVAQPVSLGSSLVKNSNVPQSGSNSLTGSGRKTDGASTLLQTKSSGETASAEVVNKRDRNSFDSAMFWREVIYINEDENDSNSIHLDAKLSFADLLDPLKRKTHHKRSAGGVNIAFGSQGFELPAMAVKLYNPCMKARKGSAINLDLKTNIPLITETKYICHDTAAILTEMDQNRSLTLGTEEVTFKPSEMREMTAQFGTPGLRILGFKSKKLVKISHQIGPPIFIHPDDSRVIGSSKVFKALVLKMDSLEKAAIAELIPRKNSAPRIVALLPQLESFEADGNKDESFGLHVIPLAYADDIRDIQLDDKYKDGPSHDTLVTKAKQIIKRMQLAPAFKGAEPKYDSYDYPNPSLQKHYTVLQSIALEEDYEDVADYTLPDYKNMEPLREAFKSYSSAAYTAGYNAEVATGNSGMKKRLADYPDNDPKKVDIRDINFEQYYSSDSLKKLTVAILKQFLKDNKQNASGLKADLLEAAEAFCQKKYGVKEKL